MVGARSTSCMAAPVRMVASGWRGSRRVSGVYCDSRSLCPVRGRQRVPYPLSSLQRQGLSILKAAASLRPGGMRAHAFPEMTDCGEGAACDRAHRRCSWPRTLATALRRPFVRRLVLQRVHPNVERVASSHRSLAKVDGGRMNPPASLREETPGAGESTPRSHRSEESPGARAAESAAGGDTDAW